MLGFNTMPGYFGAAVQSAAPPNYPPQNQYSNPYCNVNSVPAGNQQNLYINPANISGAQANFVNQMRNIANQQFTQQQIPQAQDYYSWKLATGSRPRNSEEEAQLQQYFYQVVRPTLDRQRQSQMMQYQQSMRYGYNQPQYPSYGYYNQAQMPYGYGNYAYTAYYQRQLEMQKKIQQNQIAVMRQLRKNVLCLRHNMTKEQAEEYLVQEEERIAKSQRERVEKTTLIVARIVRGDKVLVEKKEQVPQFKNDFYDIEYSRSYWLSKQPPVEYMIVSPAFEYFRRNEEKYNKLSAYEFFKVGGELVAEVRERQRQERDKYRILNSFNHDTYNNLIRQYEDKGGKYNDGIYQDLVAYRLELERNAPEGFSYDRNTGMISIKAPDDFDEFTKNDLEKGANRRRAFYKHILGKHPEMAHILAGISDG